MVVQHYAELFVVCPIFHAKTYDVQEAYAVFIILDPDWFAVSRNSGPVFRLISIQKVRTIHFQMCDISDILPSQL